MISYGLPICKSIQAQITVIIMDVFPFVKFNINGVLQYILLGLAHFTQHKFSEIHQYCCISTLFLSLFA